MAAVPEITTTQLFSRAALGNLWKRRAELDDNTQDLLNSLYNNRKKSVLNGSQEITYHLSRKSKAGQLGFGRLYANKGSLEQLQNECRATICKDYYHDIDIVNAQPTLLVQLVRQKLDKDMPELDYYIDHRDAVLRAIMDANNCNRDDAKQEVIRILYGGSTKIPALQPLFAEVRGVAKQLSRHSDYTELFDALKHEKNHYGSFLAYITQTEERRCMLAMREHLMDLGWSVDILAYDGVMVRKRDGHTITDELLAGVMEAIKAETGYDVRILEKPLIGFDIEEAAGGAGAAGGCSEEEVNEAYAKMKGEFESNHYYFVPSNIIVREKSLLHMTLDHAATNYNGLLLPLKSGEKEPAQFIKRWMKDGTRRRIERLVYKLPEECGSDEASLFQGFAYKEIEETNDAAVPLFLDILNCCCGDDTTVANYVLRYFADMIQHPFQRPGVALIYTSSTHGTGKDSLVSLMGRVIGDAHSKHYANDSIWNTHDTKREGAILIHIEEANAAANKSRCGELKALVTADKIGINPKGVKAYDVPNICRIVMTTNEADPIKLEISDRRFVIMRPSDRLHARGLDWWASIQELLMSPAMSSSVGRYLETIDLTGWNPRFLPTTAIKEELMEFSRTTEEEFLLFIRGEYGGEKLLGQRLYNEYTKWYREQGMDQRFMIISPNNLGKRITDWANKHFNRKTVSAGTQYTIIPLAGGAGGAVASSE